MPNFQQRYPWLKVDEQGNAWCTACIHFSALAPGDKLSDPKVRTKPSRLLALIDDYSGLFEGTETQECQKQWRRLKHHIKTDPDLRAKPFEELWPDLLVDQYSQGAYNIVLRLVVFVILFACDTSENERLFSLMNRLMTSAQGTMKHEVIRSLIWWHECNKRFSPEQWEEALRRIYVEWSRADDTKSGKRHFSRHDRPPVISLLDGPAKETVTYAGLCSATEADFKVEALLSEKERARFSELSASNSRTVPLSQPGQLETQLET
jgi:hypothetical protein